MNSKMAKTFSLILVWICFSQCHAQVGTLRQYRLQRQRQSQEPYAAAGYRPGRQFVLPQEQDQEQPQPQNVDESDFGNGRRPELTYGAPAETARLIQAQQQYFLAPAPAPAPALAPRSKSARLSAASAKSARLAVNSEVMPEDAEDDNASDIEVDVKTESVPRAANPQASTVYYPAGAVSFVQPFPGAGSYVQTAQAPAQPSTAAYVQPLQYSNFQIQPAVGPAPGPAPAPAAAAFVQPALSKLQVQPLAAAPAPAAPFYASTAAFTAAPSFYSSAAPASAAFVQPAYSKLQVQPVAAAKLEAQPVAAAPAAPASFYASPSFFSSPALAPAAPAAYTAPLAQQQFYFSAPAMAAAQLQAW